MSVIVEIGPDARNINCRRVHVDGAQWCKVYGFSEDEAEHKARIIAAALRTAFESVKELGA